MGLRLLRFSGELQERIFALFGIEKFFWSKNGNRKRFNVTGVPFTPSKGIYNAKRGAGCGAGLESLLYIILVLPYRPNNHLY